MSPAPTDQKLYLDDIAVGQEFLSREQRIEADQIVAFATEYDPQPFHTDAEAAQATFFQGLAASGWHTMAITMNLLVRSVPFAHGIIGAGGEISWPRPTRPGDVLHVKSKVIEIRPSQSKPDRATVILESLTYNQDGEVAQKLVSKLIAFKRER
ncbi:MaoC family dehydratase [Microvirga sp. BT689]|uniref:MaoC family dehydratase n=1 Tax=Microvirga arvi TaxID=2778731 RepID=UPI00194DE0EF|nr:MaoC family dehydratase [Microvirga arvi]MBM6583064.1 MaoC family dehydratase [Microvirga arvi]